MDLIYMNHNREDIGVLQEYEFDLAFGSDENNFELKASQQNHCCDVGFYVYIEGTEYGGIVDAIESDTASEEVIYTGRTWHGILNSKVLCPDAGQDYLNLTGEANTVLGTLLSRIGLTSLFAVSTDDSGIAIEAYQFDRYCNAYDGIRKMLSKADAKLHVSYENGTVVLSAVPVAYYPEVDSDMVELTVKKTGNRVNHLICLGSGELKDRMVVHLYADASGNISQTQTQTGVDEYTAVYEYSSTETEEELAEAGTEYLKELIQQDSVSVDFGEADDEYSVGDIIGAVDNVTGISVSVPITKKIVSIKDGVVTIDIQTETGSMTDYTFPKG